MARTLRFDAFEVDLAAHRLFKHGARVRLRDQSFQVLALLLTHAGDVVTRDDLRRQLWSLDTFVDFENSLNTAVGRLREALGDSADQPRYVETLPRLGYRFVASVTDAWGSDATRAPTPRIRLMVLPLANASGDPSLEYFNDAITDDVIAELAALAPTTLGVIARTTAMHYKGTPKSVAEIARELSLDWVVEGSVRRMGDRFALTIQLVRTRDETHAFARRYEADLGDIFSVERCVAQAVGYRLGLPIDNRDAVPGAAPDGHRPKYPTRDLLAYNSYIQGRHIMERVGSPQSYLTAREHLEAAVARDPQFALAHDALAELWWYMGFLGMVPPTASLAAGMPHAQRAVDIDGGLAEARAMLAQYRKQVEFNWREVEREMTLALELNPSSPTVRRRHAITALMPHGRLDEAARELEIALDLDPMGLWSRMWLPVMFWLKREHARGIEEGRLLLEFEPGHPVAHLVMGIVSCEAEKSADGIAALRKAADLTGGSPLMLGWLGLALAESGDTPGARGLLARLDAMPPHVYVPPTSRAWIHLGLGEIDQFFAWTGRAIDARDHMITPIKSYPFMDPIRTDPRYADLLRQMNLA